MTTPQTWHPDKLAKLATARWTEFVDAHRLIAVVLTAVRAADLVPVSAPAPSTKMVQVSVSEFNVYKMSMTAEFVVPSDANVASGSVELVLAKDGSVTVERVTGVRFTR